jgi:D-sedoheptulose 7-phosphate isomerase
VQDHVDTFLEETARIALSLDRDAVRGLVEVLGTLRAAGGRLFILGLGGSAANASHAAADLRRLAGIECWCPLDNASELTAAINDDGWDDALVQLLRTSQLGGNDAVLVLSVGGGDRERSISVPLINAMAYAKRQRARVLGIVGRDGGATARMADTYVLVPQPSTSTVTMHTEAFQAVLWHLLVCHPALALRLGTWESAT